MSIKQLLMVMDMHRELNQLRAEKFALEQRIVEAETFLRQCHLALEDSRRIADAIPYGMQYNHPAFRSLEQKQAACCVADYLYQVITGGKRLKL